MADSSGSPPSRTSPEAWPLGDIRVLDLSRVVSGPYLTQILGDLGAEVIRIEAVPAEEIVAAVAGAPLDRDEAFSWGLNRNKRSVCIDLKSPEGHELMLDLVEQADVIFDNFRPGVLERLGLTHAQVSQRNPSIVSCSLTGFGEIGPWARSPAYDPIVQALSGTMSFTGTGLPGGTPVRWGIPIGDLFAGIYGALGIIAALLGRDRTGTGAHVEVSMHDVALAMNTYRVPMATTFGKTLRPQPYEAGQGTVPYGTFECRDGRWLAFGVSARMWRAACTILGRADLIDDPRFADPAIRYDNRKELTGIIAQELRRRPAREWEAEFLDAGVVAGVVTEVAEVFDHPQLRAREMIRTIRDSVGREATVVGDPLKLAGGEWRAPTPLGFDTHTALRGVLGYDENRCQALRDKRVVYWPRDAETAEPLRSWRPPDLSDSDRDPADAAPPLARFTVLELDGEEPSKCFAGQILADLGLRVIRVERPVGDRHDPFPDQAYQASSRSGLNRNKQSIVLDLKSSDGRVAIDQLLSGADVMLDNYRPGVLGRLGLDWDAVSAAHPKLVSCSITGYGHTGPWSAYPAFDGAIQALGGGMSLTVDPLTPGRPVRWGIPMGGETGSLFAALGIVAALRGRRHGAAHRRLDLSLLDAQVSLLCYRVPQALTVGMRFAPEPRMGGSGSTPVGTFATAAGQWFTMCITQRFWSGFCEVVDHPEWCEDPRFATEPDRREHIDELTTLVSEAMLAQDAATWQRMFFDRGLPGAAVLDIPSAFAHEQAQARGMALELDDPVVGPVTVAASALRFDGMPVPAPRPAPLPGRDSDALAAEFGLTAAPPISPKRGV